MLKLLSPLFATGRCVISRPALSVHQPYKQYSQAVNEAAKTEESNNEVLSEANSTAEDDKLYSRLEIELRGSDPMVMKSYSWFATTAAGHLGIEVGKNWDERKARKERLTLLKSAFVHKKHRVQYEIRTYFRFIHFHKLTESTLTTFLEYIERNLPEGVALKATKIEIMAVPEHLTKPPTLDDTNQ